jgi:hypothetical protein
MLESLLTFSAPDTWELVVPAVLRVWDVLLYEGNRSMLFRTGLALMETHGNHKLLSLFPFHSVPVECALARPNLQLGVFSGKIDAATRHWRCSGDVAVYG